MKAIKGKVIIKMDVTQKSKYALTDDVTIFIEKGYDFNLRQDRSSMGYVIDGEGLKEGVQVLCHHLAIEPSYIIENDEALTPEEVKEGYKVFSVPVDMIFCFFDNGEWHPCKNFLITKRIFLPYSGKLTGLEHQVVKNRMFVVKGEDEWEGETKDLSGKCLVTEVNCDYEIIFHNKNNREERIIRTRHREILAVDEGVTKLVSEGVLLVGLNSTDCSKIY